MILVVILLFALLGIAGLLIDQGMARLTQAQMQSVADEAAMEGGWELAAAADDINVRNSVLERSDDAADSWGARRIEFETDGFDLDNDGVAESSLTINRETLGELVKPMLDANFTNAPEGDVVIGQYDVSSVPDVLPGQPTSYNRGQAFQPSPTDEANAILVRLRRTGETDLAGGTSGEPLAYLWSRGSLMNLGLKGRGIKVRGESIAQLVPAVAVGTAVNPDLPTAINAAIRLEDLRSASFLGITLLRPENSFQIGSPMIVGEAIGGIGYLPIADSVVVDGIPEFRVVGFMLASVVGNDVTPMSLSDMGYERTNVTANLGWITDGLSSEIVRINQSLLDIEGDLIARAPRLVRSRQIHAGDSP